MAELKESVTQSGAEEVGEQVETKRIEHITRRSRIWFDEQPYGLMLSNAQAYEDMGIRTPEDKHAFRNFVSTQIKIGKAEHGDWGGLFKKVNHELNLIPILTHPTNLPKPFPLVFPGEIEKMAYILPGQVIAVSGSKNSGKTLFCLSTAYANRMNGDVYFFAAQENTREILDDRLSKFGYPPEEWQKINFVRQQQDFHQVIQPNAINIIDYFAVPESEFFKMGTFIDKIANRIEKGILLLALQMNPGKRSARGGDQTKDRAALYIILDGGKAILEEVKNVKREIIGGGLMPDPNKMSRTYTIEKKGSWFNWTTPWWVK